MTEQEQLKVLKRFAKHMVIYNLTKAMEFGILKKGRFGHSDIVINEFGMKKPLYYRFADWMEAE